MTDKVSMQTIEPSGAPERAVLVGLALSEQPTDEVDESLEEMKRLAWTAGAEVVCTIVQRRDKPDPATLIGRGKIAEVQAAAEEWEAGLVLFDADLSPAQNAKLQDALNTDPERPLKVVDRTQLILDIFAQRAQTNEGKLQVELAQLQYNLTRLTGRGAEMTRLGGGIGTRGPGEQKLEVDRRVIRRRIDRLRGDLEKVRKSRRVQRKQRNEQAVATVSLVGYTNAGKSSLLRALAHSDAFVEDKLFATLDPTSRRCDLPSGRTIVLTDTVGFIRKLPHHLVAAFRATLEEVVEADLLLVVADAAHPAVEDQIRAVYDVLEEIGAAEKPALTAFNKVDIADSEQAHQLISGHDSRIPVSARTGEGSDALLRAIDEYVRPQRQRVHLRIPQREARLAAQVHANGKVLDERYEGDDILLDAEIEPHLRRQLIDYEYGE
ncbi:MAG: GTPase HflX [Candidatus Hydrogenedentota bacterium]